MKISRELLRYTSERIELNHHILIFNKSGKKILLSAINLYLNSKATNSVNTSDKYSSAIKRFLDFLLNEIKDDYLDHDFWRKAKLEHIRTWQRSQVIERDEEQLKKPSDKTIRNSAQVVYQFYCWASDMGFPTIINSSKKNWTFNYRDESKLMQVSSMISGSSPDTANIDINGKKNTNNPKSKKVIIMPNESIKSLMAAYVDPVYPVILKLALATGMRECGCTQIPFLGIGENAHIRPYPDICNEIDNGKKAKTFSFTVTEKGKERTLQVNMAAWEVICASYLPIYYERVKIFKKKCPDLNSNNYFFLKKNGMPVTAKNISDQTYQAKSKLTNFPWTFHSSRDWFSTKFIIKHLSKSEINNMHYNAAVEKLLRQQIGHSDIKTTYLHYVQQASLILAIEDGKFDLTLGHDKEFFESL